MASHKCKVVRTHARNSGNIVLLYYCASLLIIGVVVVLLAPSFLRESSAGYEYVALILAFSASYIAASIIASKQMTKR